MPAVTSYAPRGQPHRRRVPVFRNDNWPPCPPAQALPVPSFLGSPDSDTLLRALPTPSFVTPEMDKPPVPSKATIAASAVPLADWFADVVWALYLGPQTASTGGNSALAGADKAPQPLAAFVHAVLSQTLASPQCAALGLYYLVRLPVRLGSAAVRMGGSIWSVGVDAEGHTCYASVHDRERAARAAFVAELYGPGGEDVPYRLAALALMLGNKWLDDHTFTNKTWHQVTHLSLTRLTALEQRALECFNYSLGVANDDWRAWLGVLKEGAQGAGAGVNGTGVAGLAVDVMERLEKEVQVLKWGVGAGVEKGVIGDRRGSVSQPQPQVQSSVPVQNPAPMSEMDLDELEMQQVEIDIDLDDGGPVPDELRRPVKVRLGAGGRVEAEHESREVKEEWKAEKACKEEEKTCKKTWKEELDEEMEASGDEWERALRAAGDGESWLMGIVEDGEDRYARDRLARDAFAREVAREARAAHTQAPRDYTQAQGQPQGWPTAEWDRARDPPMLTRARGDIEPVQRPRKDADKKKDARVELYDACFPQPYVECYGYQGGYDYQGGCDPYKGYEAYKGGYEAYNVGHEAYNAGCYGAYYTAYEAVPRDVYPSYVPRQVPVAW